MEDFWNELNECVESLQKRGKVVILGDMNAKVVSEERESVMGRFGVDRETVERGVMRGGMKK